ncbi:MAG: DUF2225 domain-containing protein [Lachnospiraceae bacterium]|nr:DUF2225 domain-containing protein [Lachnospiraceae bacterium]MBQ8006889.1 DUF2225 domain-containing protein [Lachnospiraceae bacterium]
MGLLSGLSDLGLGKLEGAEIFEEEKKPEPKKVEEPKEEAPFDENDVLFDKSAECPVCGKKFTFRAVRTGKARPIGQDPDLRTKYEKFDPAKYDVVVCPYCGYAVLTKYFTSLPAAQVKLLREGIGGKVHGVANNPILSYDDAIQRYQLALASSIVKHAKDSEKAFVCLKMAWVIRGKKESITEDDPDYEEVMKQLRDDENEALKAAYEGFVSARQKESFPIAGMDEITIDYLLAVLSARFEKYDVAQKLIAGILLNRTANNRIKDRARDLKDQVLMEMKSKGEFS